MNLKQYIEKRGEESLAKELDVSIETIRSWRYGNRQPSTDQAKKIIVATEGKLDFFSIYGPIDSEKEDTSETVE